MPLSLLLILGLLLQSKPPEMKRYQMLLDGVAKRLLQVARAPQGTMWPPTFEVVSRTKRDSIGAWSIPGSITVSSGMMKHVVQNDESRLAFVAGHELAHLLLNHSDVRHSRKQTPFASMVFSREEELAADSLGAVLALKAGYSFKDGLKLQTRMIALGMEYSSFEGSGVSHPSWKERLANLDTQRTNLWRSMSAFENGTLFLRLEQYGAAAHCFQYVTDEFPDCEEAWTNLGYSLLMRYCDQLSAADVRNYGVGHLVVGGFYRRPESLEIGTRGRNATLWREAESALLHALRLDSTLTLAKANLGVCYLLHPQGTSDLEQAERYLQEAASTVYTDDRLDAEARFAVLVNSGVVEFASGQRERLLARLEDAEKSIEHTRNWNMLNGAVVFNRALYLSTSTDALRKPDAVELFGEYLRTVTPALAWWDIAYEHYVSLCTELKRTPEDLSSLKKKLKIAYRPIVSLAVGNDIDIALQEQLEVVKRRLGNAISAPVLKGSRLTITRYPDKGISILAHEHLLGIIVEEGSGCRIPLVSRMPEGSGEPPSLYVGMTKDELDSLLGVTSYDQREFLRLGKSYRYYRRIGVAVLVEQNRAKEIIIAQIPEVQVGI